jgi:hypothetical protein
MHELRKLNLVQNKSKVNIDPSMIPNLVPKEKLAKWQEGDTKPYYKIQEIDYPIVANGITYQESFFESFVKKLKQRPIPGSKAGHEMSWGARPPTDFVMIGGKLDKNGDGSGKVYFKNYIPPEAASGSNETFIKENKTDMVHYSLVSYTKDEIERDADNNIVMINVVESIKGERNDAVEYGLGAMDQKTNKNISLEDEKVEGKKEGEMTRQELLEKLKTLKANAEITLNDVAEALGLSSQVVTDEHKEALKVFNSLKKAEIDNPVEKIKELEAEIKLNSVAVRNAELDKEFGADEDKKNYLRQYAGEQAGDLTGEELKTKINEIKESEIAKQLAKSRADYMSDENIIGVVETKKSNKKASDFTSDSVDVL